MINSCTINSYLYIIKLKENFRLLSFIYKNTLLLVMYIQELAAYRKLPENKKFEWNV